MRRDQPGSGSARKSAAFGTRRPGVQVPPTRLMAVIEIDFSHPVCRGSAVSKVQGHRDRKMAFHPHEHFWWCTWKTIVMDEATHGTHSVRCGLTKSLDDALRIGDHGAMPA